MTSYTFIVLRESAQLSCHGDD